MKLSFGELITVLGSGYAIDEVRLRVVVVVITVTNLQIYECLEMIKVEIVEEAKPMIYHSLGLLCVL